MVTSAPEYCLQMVHDDSIRTLQFDSASALLCLRHLFIYIYGHCLVTLPLNFLFFLNFIKAALVRACLNAESFWWWQCSVRCSLPLSLTFWDLGPHQCLFGDNSV